MNTTTSSPRWDRLVADLAPLAEVKVDSKPYSEMRYGRVSYGTSYSLSHRLPNGNSVEIHDAWWRKNADVWIGWQMDLVDREGIIKHHWRPSKKRSEVVAAFQQAMEFKTS